MILAGVRIRRVSATIGDGVFATSRIPRGTIVWTQDHLDRVWGTQEMGSLPDAARAAVERYAHVDAAGNRILCWDAGKLINHSCEPTLRGVGAWFQVARRDIEVGEELTCDYAECNIDPALDCDCGARTCRHRIHALDLLVFREEWDHEARELLAAARGVVQPLWEHLLDPAQARAWFDGQEELPSFAELCAFAAPPASNPSRSGQRAELGK